MDGMGTAELEERLAETQQSLSVALARASLMNMFMNTPLTSTVQAGGSRGPQRLHSIR